MAVKLGIQGIQEAQAANNLAVAALRSDGALGRAIQVGTAAAHRYAVALTHVDTGALRASHRMRVETGRQARGLIYIDPEAVNPHGKKPIDYGPVEHGRGGAHAFYERTAREYGEEIGRQMMDELVGGLPK